MGGSASMLVGLGEDVVVAWEASKAYGASLFGAAASAYGAVKSAAADASRSVRELVRRLFGSGAAAAAKRKLEKVVQMLRAGASSASSAITEAGEASKTYGASLFGAAASAYEAVKSAAADASRSVVELVTRLFGSDAAAAAKRKLEEVALSEFGSCLAERAASSAADAMAQVRSIPGVEELLGFIIPTEAKISITVVSVAVILYLKFFCPPAGAVAGAMMKAPGGGGLMILRSIFEADPKLYFSILRSAGPAAAAARFVTPTCLAF